MAEGFLLLDEVAGLARVSVDTVRFWIRAGKLASVRPGRRRMVRRDVLETFLGQDFRPPKSNARSTHVQAAGSLPATSPCVTEEGPAGVAPTELERRLAKNARRRLGLPQ